MVHVEFGDQRPLGGANHAESAKLSFASLLVKKGWAADAAGAGRLLLIGAAIIALAAFAIYFSWGRSSVQNPSPDLINRPQPSYEAY